MKLLALEAIPLKLALRASQEHAGAERTTSECVIVRARIEGGPPGFGESIPRPYLTGETVGSVTAAIAEWQRELVGVEATPAAWVDHLRDLSACADKGRRTAAFAGVELSLLDAVARAGGQPLGALLGIAAPEPIAVALPILGASLSRARFLAGHARDAGATRVKVKVGLAADRERVQAVRAIVGAAPALWADANGAWSATVAVDEARALRDLGITAVEQPVAAADLAGLGRVEREAGIRVSADESLCTLADAMRLLEAGSCSIWNLRVAKCGGLLNSLRLAALARRNGVAIQIGALVGETSILAAAGLWLAAAIPDHVFFEGCYGDAVLRHDVVAPSLRAGFTGRSPRLGAVGLGVSVDERRIG